MKSLTFHYDFRTSADGGLLALCVPGGKPERFCQLRPERSFPHAAWEALPGAVRDLLDLVQVIFAVDRLSSRQPDSDGYGWGRRLHVRVPVRALDFWKQRSVTQQLHRLLNFLTVDDWDLEWHSRSEGMAYGEPDTRRALVAVEQSSTTFLLHSGGLDALAGVCHQILDGETAQYALVSVATADRVVAVQHEVAAALRRRFPGRVYSLPLRLRLSRPLRGRGLHRCRSFVFQALGAVEAYAAGSYELLQCENGIASLSLPLVFEAFPWQTARGVHPRFLTEMSTFLSMVFGREFRVVNRYLFRTKAQMCSAIQAAGAAVAVGLTVSCEFFPQRLAGKPVCGKCGPCLLRRQALFASGLSGFDQAERYRYDVTDTTTRIPRDGRLQLDAMLCQRERLRNALAAPDPWLTLVHDYPELDGTMRSAARAAQVELVQARHEICRMLACYVEEWEHFPTAASYPDAAGTHDRRRVRPERPETQLSLLEHRPVSTRAAE